MTEALYGDDGFYLAAGTPARHFRTAAHASPLWGRAIGVLAARIDSALREPADFTIVDVGAGGGELLAQLATSAPARWRLIGVDHAPRPAALPSRVEWIAKPPRAVRGVLLACELLDVVPVDVVELTDAGPRLVAVARDGRESLAGAPEPDDLAWLDQWWPLADVGDRAEIGTSRDRVWRDLCGCVTAGVAVAIDYASAPSRDVAGTLTGYRDGRQVLPVPDGSCDLTAHVRIDSLATAGDVTLSQRDGLRMLGTAARPPSYGGDPTAYVAELSAAGEAAELLDPNGLGGFTWLLHPQDVNVDDVLNVDWS
jgi:SAM-dependent MidA family methyltransferase